jgi:hypothetical protein
MKYFTREYFCENWTYVKCPIENTKFSKFAVGIANLALIALSMMVIALSNFG